MDTDTDVVAAAAVVTGAIALDSQQVEILGRNIVKAALIEAGLEVATPERDNGIDLIAYRWHKDGEFVARPVQIKAASDFSFGIDRKYERIPGLIMVYVVGVRRDTHDVFAMNYPELLAIANRLGWTKTPSWTKGDYSTRHQGKRVMEQLEPFRAGPQTWRRLFVEPGPGVPPSA